VQGAHLEEAGRLRHSPAAGVLPTLPQMLHASYIHVKGYDKRWAKTRLKSGTFRLALRSGVLYTCL